MKQLVLCFAVFAITFGFSQNQITLTLNGLTEEANNSLQKGEYILDLTRLDNKKTAFFAKVQNTDGGSTKFVKINEKIEPNNDGKYDFSLQFIVEKTGSLDFSKEIKVVVEGETTFGNHVWVEKNISPADFGQPIWMDNYGNKSISNYPPKKKMEFTLVGPRKIDDINDEVEAAGDALKELTLEDIHLMAKNVESDSWAINDYPAEGTLSRGRTFGYRLDPADTKLNITKPVLLRIGAKTKNGGVIWEELTLEPWELGGLYPFGMNYSKESVLNFFVEELVEESEPEPEPEVIEQMNEVEEPVEVEEVVEEIKEEAPLTEVIPERKCAVDSLTKQLQFEGGKLCVNNVVVSRGTTNSATLLYDTQYTLNGNTYTLAGGKKIQYHNKKNYLLSAHINQGMEVKNDLGTMELAPNQEVEFSQKGIYKAKLEKDAMLTFNDQDLIAKSEIEFDKLGRLASLTLAKEMTWNYEGSAVKLPVDSYLKFKNGELNRVQVEGSTAVVIGDKTFEVVQPKKGASLIFNAKNVLESFVIGSGYSTTVDGKEITIGTSSEVEVVYVNEAYTISSFEIGDPVTMDVYKGSKVKSVDVKAGKRLIIENNKVVKVK